MGGEWYFRGLNRAEDFCYVELETVRFNLKISQHVEPDYQLQEDGSIKMKYFGARHQLVFKSGGTITEWSSVVAYAPVEI